MYSYGADEKSKIIDLVQTNILFRCVQIFSLFTKVNVADGKVVFFLLVK